VASKKHGFIGASSDIWGIDMGTTDKEMDVIFETYQELYGFTDMEHQACVTGKSKHNYGIQGRIQSGGMAVYHLLKHILEPTYKNNFAVGKKLRKRSKLYRGLEDQKVIIQGYGTMGYWIAHYLHQNGAKIIAVSVNNCSIYNENGLNPHDLLEGLNIWKKERDWTLMSKMGEFYLDERGLYKNCDIFIPAATEVTIHKENVEKIQAKLIMEVANGAISHYADNYLNEKGVIVIPDVIAGLGTLLANYYEFLSNIDKRNQSELTKKWEEESKQNFISEVNTILEKANIKN